MDFFNGKIFFGISLDILLRHRNMLSCVWHVEIKNPTEIIAEH